MQNHAPEFPSASRLPDILKDNRPQVTKPNLTASEVSQIAIDLAHANDEKLDHFREPIAEFYAPDTWTVSFLGARLPAGPYSERGSIFVVINDKTKAVTYDSYDPLQSPPHKISKGHETPPRVRLNTAAEANYRASALKLLIQEANDVASALKLPESLPITESNLVSSFIVPSIGARARRAIGTLTTAHYTYYVSKSNQFCYLTEMNQERDRPRWWAEYLWPISRLDTNAAYHLATQWLAAASIDVQRLNEDCNLRINIVPEDDSKHPKRFIPFYEVYWFPKGRDFGRSVASVHLFLPTKSLLQLRVEDPEFNLRKPVIAPGFEPRTNSP